MSQDKATLPSPLREGDLVRLVAPAGVFDRKKFADGLRILSEQGFRVEHRADVFSSYRYMAGEDERRLSELQEALDDPEARAVWAIRGGYGAMRLLPRLDLSRVAARPKLFIGFSDMTAIHATLNRNGLATVHGPMVAGLSSAPPEVLDRLFRVIGGGGALEPCRFTPTRVIREGACSGRLLGGNLSLLTRLIGTPYLPDLEGAILLIEEVGEAPYRLDRMFTHMELSGLHEGLAGVVVGELTGCESELADYSGLDVVSERVSRWGIPAVAGLPVGHGKVNHPLLLGAPASLDCARGRLTFHHAEPGVPAAE